MIMKNIQDSHKNSDIDDLRPEYKFAYSKVKPNRFADRRKEDRIIVVLDSDVAEFFPTSEMLNDALRELIASMPTKP